MESFLEAASLKCIPSISFFWKYAEVLGQHLKSLFWKIMSYDFFVLFVSYINRNHKDTTHLQGRKLDIALYINQNVSQACQPGFLKIIRRKQKKSRDFALDRGILNSKKKKSHQVISLIFESVSTAKQALCGASNLLCA